MSTRFILALASIVPIRSKAAFNLLPPPSSFGKLHLDPTTRACSSRSGSGPVAVSPLNMAISQLHVPSSQRGPIIPGMTGGVHLNVPFVDGTLMELDRLNSTKVFVLANNSSRQLVEPLIDALKEKDILAAPLNTDIGMGGGEDGLLKAADAAVDAEADCVVTVGGGAVQDAGKLIRLWLGGRQTDPKSSVACAATVEGIRTIADLAPVPTLPPQICIPNSFAMAELTSVAGMTLKGGVKSGASNPALMPTTTIFDPTLTDGLPAWVRYGTALRCVEHAIGAATHPQASEEQRARALEGLRTTIRGLDAMVAEPKSRKAAEDVYVGGWYAVRALVTNGCYPSLGHLVQNMYSARYGVHQGSCSGILCGRLLAHHYDGSKEVQDRIAAVLSGGGDGTGESNSKKGSKSAARLVTELVATLPGVAKDHADAGVDIKTLREFAEGRPLERFNKLSPTPFRDADDVYDMLTRPLDEL